MKLFKKMKNCSLLKKEALKVLETKTEINFEDNLSSVTVRKNILNNFLKETNFILDEPDKDSAGKSTRVFTLIKQITDIITLNGAISSFNSSDLSPMTIVKDVLETRKNRNAAPMLRNILLFPGKHLYSGAYVSDFQIELSLAKDPIVLSPWSHQKIAKNIVNGIGTEDNPFSLDIPIKNVTNTYYYPVGIALCTQGNHSQYVSKLRGTGTTNADKIINIEKLYDFVRFDGDKFYYNFTDETIDQISFSVKCRQEYYAGILFEIGRLLKKYPDVFPKDVHDVLSNQYKVEKS